MAEKESKNTCGYCESYVFMGSELRGICRSIPGEKRGQRGKKVTYDMDASQCPHFSGLEEVRRVDVAQGGVLGFDFTHARAADVFETTEETKPDRLVWEKHDREARGEETR